MYLIVCCSSRVIVQRFLELSRAKEWCIDNNTLNGEPFKLYEVIHESKYHAPHA